MSTQSGVGMEQRRSSRFTVQLPMSFSGNDVAGSGLVWSLSHGGCTVVSEESVQSGTPLVLHLHLAEQCSPFKIGLAVVRWSTGGEFGLEFLRLASHERERLHGLVASLETGPP